MWIQRALHKCNLKITFLNLKYVKKIIYLNFKFIKFYLFIYLKITFLNRGPASGLLTEYHEQILRKRKIQKLSYCFGVVGIVRCSRARLGLQGSAVTDISA